MVGKSNELTVRVDDNAGGGTPIVGRVFERIALNFALGMSSSAWEWRRDTLEGDDSSAILVFGGDWCRRFLDGEVGARFFEGAGATGSRGMVADQRDREEAVRRDSKAGVPSA